MDQNATKGATTQWCAGLPLVEQLPLTEQERTVLRKERLRLSVIGVVGACLIPVTLIAFIICMIMSMDTGSGPTAVKHLALIVSLVVIGLLAAVANDSLVRSKGLRNDLRTGVKMCFAGCLTQTDPYNRTQQKLLEQRLLHQDPAREQSLIVLPGSGRVWLVNEQPLRKWITTSQAVTADAPEVAGIAAQWLEPVELADGTVVPLGHRELSDDEKTEIRRFSRQLFWKSFWPALLLSIWCFPLLYLCILDRRWPDESLYFSFLILITICADFFFIVNCRFIWRMRRDVAYGQVIITRAQATDNLDKDVNDLPSAEQTTEWLPLSNQKWTIDGLPAPWRTRATSNK